VTKLTSYVDFTAHDSFLRHKTLFIFRRMVLFTQ